MCVSGFKARAVTRLSMNRVSKKNQHMIDRTQFDKFKLVPLGSMREAKPKFGCSCGKWDIEMPDVGAYGHRTGRARMARVTMAFDAHVAYAHVGYKIGKSRGQQIKEG